MRSLTVIAQSPSFRAIPPFKSTKSPNKGDIIYPFYSAKHVAAFYKAGLITLAEERENLIDIKEEYGIGQFLNLYDAGILTLQEIAPYSHSIFFGYTEQREKLVELGLITQEMLEQHTPPPFNHLEDDSTDEDQTL